MPRKQANPGKVPQAGDVWGWDGSNMSLMAPPVSTVLTGNFTQPVPTQTVNVSLGSTRWMTTGMIVFISNGGYYELISVGSFTAATLKNLGYLGNRVEGATVLAGNGVVAAGIKGADGRTIISTTVDPDNGLGENGDLVYNINSSTIFGPKSGGAWGTGISLKGADGKNVELQSGGGYIQWRKVGDASWTNLVTLASLQGAQGPVGPDSVIRFSLSNGPVFRRLATLPASSAGTYDHTAIIGTFGGFGNATECYFEGSFSNREGFGYNYGFRGNQSEAGIRAYQYGDGSVVIGVYANAQFVSAAFQVFSTQAIVDSAATQISVSGLTLKFDSQLPGTYEPIFRYDSGGFRVKAALVAPRIFGTAMPAVNSTVLTNRTLTVMVLEDASTEMTKVTLSQLKQMLSVVTSSISAMGANTVDSFSYNAGAHFTDPTGHPLSFSISGGPSGIGINASTGVFNGIATQSGTFTVSVTSTDILGWTKTVSFTLTVVQVGSTVNRLYYEWDTNTKSYWAYAQVSDTDSGVGYEVLLAPLQGQTAPAQTYRAMSAGSWTFGSYTYNRRYQYIPGFAGGTDVPPGWWRQTVRKTTQTSVNRSADVQLVAGVNSSADITGNSGYTPPSNQAPIWGFIPNQTVARKRAASFTIPAATDPESQALTYSISGLPAGLSFNSSTRAVTGSATTLGTYTVVVTATDPAGQPAQQSFYIVVAASTCTDFREYVSNDNVGNPTLVYEYYTGSGYPRAFTSASELIAAAGSNTNFNFDQVRVTGGNWAIGSRVWGTNNPTILDLWESSGYDSQYDFTKFPYDEAGWIARNPVVSGGVLQSAQLIRLDGCGYVAEIQNYTVSAPPSDFSYAVPTLLSSWPESETRINSHGKAIGPGKMSLDNGIIHIEIWEGYGGTVGYFGASGGVNLINQNDHGRGADDGIYTAPEPDYSQNGKSPNPNWPGLGYNPLGIGDSYHNSSLVLAFGQATV